MYIGGSGMNDNSDRATEQAIKTLGEVIRQRRGELGLTQEELAERVGEGVRQAEISRIEHDRILLPRRSRLEQIARALDLPIGVLLAHSGWTGAEAIRAASNGVSDDNATLRAENAELETQNEEMKATIEELWAAREDLEAEALNRVSGNEKLLTIFDGVEDGIAVVNQEASIVFRNAAFTAMVERHGADMTLTDEHGERFADDAHPFRRAANGEEFSLDVLFVGAGKREAYTAHGKAMTSDDGVELGVVTIQDCGDDACDEPD